MPAEDSRQDTKFLPISKNCRDLAYNRKLAAQAGIEFHSYGRSGFGPLLKSGKPLKLLLQYLEDPSLNDPKAQNLKYLLNWQMRQCVTEGESKEFVEGISPWIHLQLTLGKVSEEEILQLATFVSGVGSTQRSEALKCRLAEAIIGGLRASHIVGLSSINWKVAAQLLDCLHFGISTQRSRSIGYNLISGLQEPQLQKMVPSISNFILRIFQSKASSDERESAASSDLDVLGQTTRLLESFPVEVRCSVIIQTSKVLVDSYSSPLVRQAVWVKLLGLWWSELAFLGLFHLVSQGRYRSGVPPRMSSQRLEILAPYLSLLNDHSKAAFLLRYWWRPSDPALEEFRTTQERMNIVDSVLSLLKFAQRFSRPIPKMFSKLFNLLQLMEMSDDIVLIVLRCRMSGIWIPTEDVLQAVRNHLKGNPSVSIRIFRSDPRLLLEQCPGLAQSFVQNRRISPDNIWKYLRRRRRRCGIAAPFNDMDEWKKGCAEMYETMASGFSKRPDLAPSMRFRHVRKCYVRFRNEGLRPVSRTMSRALTRSGIIVPLQHKNWVNSTRLRWILSVIKVVEGRDTADEVDLLVYQWRGETIRHVQLRQRLERIRQSLQNP